jgi:hypothetical protein
MKLNLKLSPLIHKRVQESITRETIFQHQILFDSLHSDNEIERLFIQYLSNEQVYLLRMFQCLIDINHDVIDDDEVVASSLRTIYQCYLIQESERDVLLTQTMRENFENNMIQIEQTSNCDRQVIQQLFQPIVELITSVLQMDCFPRFIRSDLFINYLLQKEKPYLNRISIPVTDIEEDLIVYNNNDFVAPIISKKDIRFCSVLLKDCFEWEQVSHECNSDYSSTIYTREPIYLSGDNGMSIIKKQVLSIPFDAYNLFLKLNDFDIVKRFDTTISNIEVVSAAEEQNTSIPSVVSMHTYNRDNKKRVYVSTAFCIQPDNSFVTIQKSCQISQYPDIEFIKYFCVRHYQRVNNQITLFTQVLLCSDDKYHNDSLEQFIHQVIQTENDKDIRTSYVSQLIAMNPCISDLLNT